MDRLFNVDLKLSSEFYVKWVGEKKDLHKYMAHFKVKKHKFCNRNCKHEHMKFQTSFFFIKITKYNHINQQH